jgi:CheY-like chemotaxis protein
MKQPIRARRVRPPKASALVYLVDDEPLLLDLAELTLQGAGYRLRKFLDPELAYQAFARARNKPDLIISDYAMGRTNGCDLLARCKQLAPALKTILVSGTVGPETVLNAPLTIDRFLAKPYQPAILAELVRSVLTAQ